MMLFIELYEAVYGQPRNDWSKAQWREVAEQLADGVCPTPKKRGRRKLSDLEKDNIPALSFWANQEKERALREDGEDITIEESVRRIVLQAAEREKSKNPNAKADQKLSSAVRQVRTFRQKLKAENNS